MITDKLIPRLRERFPDRAVTYGLPPAACAVFAAKHPEVGEIQIFDEGGEITLVAGNFTHGHFSDFDSKSLEDAENTIVNNVVAFLECLFADQVVMWGSQNGGGGWYARSTAERDVLVRPIGRMYVWSGPLPME